MALTFYPHEDDAQKGSHIERIGVLLEAAERYKAAILEIKPDTSPEAATKRTSPHDLLHAYNWPEMALILDEIRAFPETNDVEKSKKANMLTKLAEVYEVLRGAKMPKLEAVRQALVNEAQQLSQRTV